MIERILLADSGNGHSEEMLKALMAIPSMQRASVTVLHVVQPQITAESMAAKREQGQQLLESAVQSLHLDSGHVTTILREGNPKDEVCRVADEIDADLVIMGSRGLKRLEAILEDSVSQYVFQASSRPMLFVKDDVYVKQIHRVMVAMDNSDSAKKSLDLAMFLLRDVKGGQLLLTHVNPKKERSGVAMQNPEQDPVLAPAVAAAKKWGIAYRCISTSGKPGEEICRLAEEMSVDLLMLGSPDRRPMIGKTLPDLDRLLGGSLSDYVRVYANCPVLLERTVG
ncbi:MAG: universal stress protein [Trichocoleus desertorum ATA4-8-CV12]|jgi:nucleotide-binding universal stress UspA family protein|nr:universal stress protein [Trichocoleus desertorum ATA4-8-CV12]